MFIAPVNGVDRTVPFYRRPAISAGASAGLFQPFNPVRDLALWTFDGAAIPTPNYGIATLTGFSCYRQIPQVPDVGTVHGNNLVKNGGFSATVGAEWTLHANASVVADSTSPTGYALRLVATGGSQFSDYDIPVEAGKAYSITISIKGDGTAAGQVEMRSVDAAGATTVINYVNAGATATASYADYSITNFTMAGNARFLRIRPYANVAGTVYFTAIRVKQQATAPLVWSAADQQTLGNKGLAVYEATTNLLTNGDIETALSGTVNGFNDSFADLNAWTDCAPFLGAVAGGFTLAANVSSGTASQNRAMAAGHSEWWDTTNTVRFLFRTGGQFHWMHHWDGNTNVATSSYIRVTLEGFNSYVVKSVAGTVTQLDQKGVTLVDNTWYWMETTIVGQVVTFKVFADSPAGTMSATQVGTTATGTLGAGEVTTGKMALELRSSTNPVSIGGAFSNVCRVVIAAPPSWTVLPTAGTPAFCVSKTTKFSGTYSLSIYNNNAGATGRWTQTTTVTATTNTLSGRVKTSAIAGAGTGVVISMAGIGNNTGATNTDWAVHTRTGTATANATLDCQAIQVSGYAWFDLLGLEQKAYNTLNSGDGQEYVTGSRTASSDTEPLPNGFSIADFSRVIAVRLDHAYNAVTRNRIIWHYYVDANNLVVMFINSAGQLIFQKGRAGVFSQITDAGVTALAAGDELTIGVRHSATVGLELQISKNGGAISTYTLASTEAKTPTSGTPTNYLGRDSSPGGELDGTIGIDRQLNGGLLASDITAIMSNL